MTTKPKARKFRIRRSEPLSAVRARQAAAAEAAAGAARRPAPDANALSSRRDDGFGATPFPGSAAAEQQKTAAATAAKETARVRTEGLTDRQLRMARRLAAKYGLEPADDFEAVRMLRARGIDPLERSSMLELVMPDQGGATAGAPAPKPDARQATRPATKPRPEARQPSQPRPTPAPPAQTPPAGRSAPSSAPTPATAPAAKGSTPPSKGDGAIQLPQKVPQGKPPVPRKAPPPPAPATKPKPQPQPSMSGAAEILEMQRDIARRRRKKLARLGIRLALLVLLPTLIALWYYAGIATPMYATKSEFRIEQADAPQTGMGGLFAGSGLATSTDSMTVQSYLGSREAMLRLDGDLGFRQHFSQDHIDPLQRLDPDATNEEVYAVYQDRVQIGFDPTEGIIRMEVSAADPETSAAFSKALVGYAEERVDGLTERLRADQMAGARENFDEAEAKQTAAQERVLELQERLGVLDPASESSSLMGQVTQFETELAQKRLQLAQLNDNPAPNAARVAGVEGDITRLEGLIASLRAQMTSEGDESSLASVSSQLRRAEADLETRTLMMQEALQSLETARIEAQRQTRYLSVGVNPVPPDEPTYPRVFENTAVAFLIFAGLYLMVSLTASILREQVSS